MTNLQTKIDRARWWALTTPGAVFYGQCMMNLGDSLAGLPGCVTAATDGKSIHWHAPWLEKLTDQEVRYVLLHETLHCAHLHLWRLPHDKAGNIAGDHAINLLLNKSNLDIKMPSGGLADSVFDGLAEEEIYHRIPKNPDDGDGGDPGGCGGFIKPAPGGTPGNDQKGPSQPGKGNPGTGGQDLKEKWEKAVIQASMAAQGAGCGSIPADMERLIKSRLETRLDWRQELAEFVKTATGTRNDWSRSSRRHAWQKVIYPRRFPNEYGTIVFVRDTSGSVSREHLNEFTGLIENCVAEVKCSGLVIDCGCSIDQEQTVLPGEPVGHARGGGGTDFACVFDRVEVLVSEGQSIAGLIYLTDLDGPHWQKLPDYPVLWIVQGKGYSPPPFGRVVEIA